ncbi:uncharacterized protein [Linepithema humile]|uniref:uncharacterized protein isoform X2 n=1 Tax=Linepithema humile TaxID=83485 RepID=UPI00351EDE90
MSTTIQQGLRPLFLMCFIMGFGIYPIKQLSKLRFHRWIAYLSILYLLTIWFVFGYVFFYTFTNLSLKVIIFWNITNMVIMAIQYFTAIASTILIFYHQKKFQIYMKKLAAVDDTLEKLGNPKTYQKLHMLTRRIIIGWIVHTLIINIYSTICCFKFFNQISWRLLLFNVINHPCHMNEFTDLIFIFLLWYIGTKFDKINDHMRCLSLKEEHRLNYIRKKPVISYGYFLHRYNYKWTLWTSMHLHLELCRIARELNVIFGIQITFEMVSHFTFLTSHCYYLCRILEQKHKDERSLHILIGIGFWFFASLIRLYALNYICESVKHKANNIDKIIHQLTNAFRYADIWKDIDFFVLHITQYPLKFTGLGLFYLGNEFFQKFLTTIVTFVIIMVQLNMLFLKL